jgi:uncharacterized GH25 family protein
MTPRALIATLLLAGSLSTLPAAAHEFWLAPSQYVVPAGTPITVRAFAGTGFRGESKPWDPTHSVRFTARTAHPIDMTRAASPGDLTWIHFAPSDAGGAMLAFESGFTPIELPAAQFEKYLADEGLDGPLAARRHAGTAVPGRERYRRCAKAWLAGSAADRATVAAGLPLEIVPLSSPGHEPSLRVRVLWNGRPLASGLVKAWLAPLGSDGSIQDPATRDSIRVAWRGRTDARGEVLVPCAASGEWLLSVVQMVPCLDRNEADWESTWASFTFQRADGVSPQRVSR